MPYDLNLFHNHLIASGRRKRGGGLPTRDESRRDLEGLSVLLLYEAELGGRR